MSGLSKEEVEAMVQDAQAHQEADKKAREAVEKRNQLDGLVLQVEKTLTEHKDKLPADEITQVESALAEAKKVLEDKTAESATLEQAYQALLTASHKLAEIMYKDSGNAGSGEQGPGDQGAGTPEEPEITK